MPFAKPTGLSPKQTRISLGRHYGGFGQSGSQRGAGGITPDSLARFLQGVKIAEKVGDEQLFQIIHALLIVTAQVLIDLTPSDTGNMMGNWFFTQGAKSPEYQGFRGTRNDRSIAKARLMKQVNVMFKRKESASVFTNNSPYSLEVEFGRYPIRPELRTGKRSQAIFLKKQEREERGTSNQKHVGGFTGQAPGGIVRVAAAQIEAQFLRKIRILMNN